MAGLPKGWESDYDGSRWFYRYKATGLTQFNFPKPGDEFPEFVSIGYGPLDLAPEEKLASEQQIKRRTSDGSNNAGNASRTNSSRRKKAPPVEEGYEMGATGYFDPDSFLYFGHNDVSPVAGEDGNMGVGLDQKETEGVRDLTDIITPGQSVIGNPIPKNGIISPGAGSMADTPNERPAAYEFHEDTHQVWTPVGFVAELASSDTVKCAEELAPIELDATSFAPAPIRTDLVHNGPVELPTHRSPVDPKPVPEPATSPLQRPVNEYPLVSASFAYPPLKATRDSMTNKTSFNVHHEELKVLASERPPSDHTGQNKYQPWTPAQEVAMQESRLPNRNSMILSQASILQTQDSDLGSFSKRHSLSGPIGTGMAHSDIPDALRVQMKTKVSMPPPNCLKSPIPAVLQPATPPSKVLPSQESSTGHPSQTVVPAIPGSGARHESISSGRGTPISSNPGIQPGLAHVPSALKPGVHPQQVPDLGNKVTQDIKPLQSSQPVGPNNYAGSQSFIQNDVIVQETHTMAQMHIHGIHSNSDRVNTLPSKLPSQITSHEPPRMNGGPGFLFFHEIPTSKESKVPENNQHQSTMSGGQVSISNVHDSNQPSEKPHIVMNEPLPVIAPLTLAKPQQSNSPKKPSASSPNQSPAGTFDQMSEVISIFNSNIPQANQARPADSIEVNFHSSAHNSDLPGSTSAASGASKPSTGIPNPNTEPVTGQHPPGHNQQPTTSQIVSEGMISSFSQGSNTPNSTTAHPPSNGTLGRLPDRTRTPGAQVLHSSHVSPSQSPSSGHRPSLPQTLHNPSSQAPSPLQRPTSVSGSHQGSKPSNSQASPVNNGSNGQPPKTSGPTSHSGVPMKPGQTQSSLGQTVAFTHPSQATSNQQKPPSTPSPQAQQLGSRPNVANSQPHGSMQSQMSGRPNTSAPPPGPGGTNHQQIAQPLAVPTTHNPNSQVTSQPTMTTYSTGPAIGQYVQRPSSVSMSSQHVTQHPQPTTNHAHSPSGNPIQVNQVIPNRPNGHLVPHQPQQASNVPAQSMISRPQAPMQGPLSHLPSNVMSPNQLASGSKPAPPSMPHGQNPSSTPGPSHNQNLTQTQPQQWSPPVHHISPSQSQVSSPTPSIASMNRPPSSASSHMHVTATLTTGPNTDFNSSTNQQSPNPRPPITTQQPSHAAFNRPQNPQHPPTQGMIQTPQQPNPLPMLPGQVTPLPSQVGSPPVPVPVQQQHFNGHMKPTANVYQPSLGQQRPQVAPPRPSQQPAPGQPVQVQYMSGIGQPTPGQAPFKPLRPQTQIQPTQQQQIPLHGQATGQLRPQGVGQFSQQTTVMQNQTYTPQMIQSPPAVSTPVAGPMPSFAAPPTTQGQQPAQAPAGQSSVQLNLQGKPFNSAQATAAITDAGKGMKKWAKKMWQNPALKQTTAAVGGAIVAESLGVNGVTGAALASQIYNTSKPRPQVTGPQRPPGLPHAQTAPPQAQGIPGPVPQQYQTAQAMNRPQPGMQLVGVQTPGRPVAVAVQNQAMMGATLNINGPQQVGAMQQRPPPPPQMMMIMQRPPPPRPFPAQPNQAQDSMDPNVAAFAAIGGAAVGAAIRANQNGPSRPGPGPGPGSGSQAEQHHAASGEYHAQASGEHHAQPSEQYGMADSNDNNNNNNMASDSYFAGDSTAYATTNTAADTTQAESGIYAETGTYGDAAAYADTSMYADTTMYSDTAMYTDTTMYVDASSYADTTAYVDVNVDVNVDVSMNETAYSGDMSMVSVEESVSVSADYSGGDWGGGGEW